MAVLNFPADTSQSPYEENGIVYEWDGQAWVSDGGTEQYLPISGGTVTGDLTVNGDSGVGGDLTVDGDASINGLTVGRGAGDVDTNTTVGNNALNSNTTGAENTAIGQQALSNNTTGYINTALGTGALSNNTQGHSNTALGVAALSTNAEGNNNTAVGLSALQYNTTGSLNTAVGTASLTSNTTGDNNTAVGRNALYSNTDGGYNTAVGISSLYANTTGDSNTVVGSLALSNNTTGNINLALGVSALLNNTTGTGNIGIGGMNSNGFYAPVFDPTVATNRIVMGSTAVTNAYVQVAWTVTSDARDKTSFASVPYGLDFVKQLQPTAYRFKAGSRNARDPETNELIPVTTAGELPIGPVRYGFKAQDILALEGDNPVIIDNEDPDHLRYRGEALVPVLVNAIKEQQALIETLEARLSALEADHQTLMNNNNGGY